MVNQTWNNAKRLKTKRDHILNAVIGLAAESGELLDEHKKLFFHTKKNRLNSIKLELGDVIYYLIKLIDLYDLSVEEILNLNKKKLYKRYGK